MADYSNVRALAAKTLAGHLTADLQVTDEMYLEAVELLAPPLFSPDELEVVRRELDPNQERRGQHRRRRALTAQAVGARLAMLERSDLSPVFVERLASRLQGRTKRFTELQRARPFHRIHKRQQRDVLIRGLYRQIYELLDGRSIVEHPILGKLEVPKDIGPKHEQALKMTHVVAIRLRLRPPSVETMRNIISRKAA